MTQKFKLILIFSMVLMMLVMPVGNIGVTNVSAGGYCDWIQYVADVTIPDGLPVDPGIPLSKTWRLKNIGTCWWTKDYKLVFVGGAQMGGLSAVNLPKGVAPGQTIDLTIGLTAPMTPGLYNGYWELQNAAGGLFGIGQTANKPFFVEIEVVSKAAPVFDFIANAPNSLWGTEAAGRRPFPGVYGDPNGFVQAVEHPILENGIQSNSPGILMAPPAEYNEHIYGVFPAYEVKAGDRFQALMGCEYGATDCEVTFVLQYQNPDGGGTRTFWSKTKSYKNSFTKVNLSLNPLAGQKVSFVFLIRPNGPSIGDRAMWVNPVIVNSFTPGPAIPTITPQPVVTAVPTVSTLPPTTGCDRAYFVSDVSVPDGTVFTPGQTFTKTWKLRNTGKCTWTTGYSLVFSTGDQMGGAAAINLPSAVAPRQDIDLSVNLTAPNNVGNYRGYWLLKNASGGLFGIGTLGNKPFWLAIGVAGAPPPTSGNGYDFAAHACDAQWTSGSGTLGCPDTSPTKGTIQILSNPRLENNTIDARPALLTVPENVYNGYIQGAFPPFTVQSGDHFKTLVNCEYLQWDCYAVFRLDYQIDNGPVQNLWAFGERYEGLMYQADIDLSLLAGKNVKFILRVNANGSPSGDRAMWVAPAIVRSGAVVPINTPIGTVTPIVVPVSTATLPFTPVPVTPTNTPIPVFTTTVPPPVNTGQLPYTNQKYGFQFTYPANSVLGVSQDTYARINLPFTSGTNLIEKYLEVTVFENVSPCTSPLTKGYAPGTVATQTLTTLTGIQFVKESSQEGAAGQTYDWVAYSTTKGTACISMNFVLHSTNPLNFPVPPPVFNKDIESGVFLDIVSAFGWTTP
jgi:hypothetical protein